MTTGLRTFFDWPGTRFPSQEVSRGRRNEMGSLNSGIGFADYPYGSDLARIDDIRVELATADDPYG
ncbi:hypothetical protein PMIN05_001248 [Paraphaeosphaeria minitans]